MSSEPNSMRLQRLTKTMDLHSNRSVSLMETDNESVKLPMLRAINKGIKYNDLSFATSRDLRHLRKEPDQVNNIEEVSSHHSLVIIRKKYDNINKNRQEEQKQVDKLQIEHDKLTDEANRFQSQKKEGKSTVSELGSGLKAIKLQLEETEIEKKIMVSMISRLKKDKVTYDLRKYNYEKSLTQTHKYKQLINNENKRKSQGDNKTEKMKSKLLNHIAGEQKERDLHISNVQNMVQEKEDVVVTEEVRSNEMREIAFHTMQDKDAMEKNWHKVQLSHRFVEKLLRDKMHREMVKFNVVEGAFKNIKTSTGVNNSETLIKKFLNKENTYGDLLGKIAENERTIAQLKVEGEELLKENNGLEGEQEQLNSTQVGTLDLSSQQKQLTKISDKALLCHSYMQRLVTWVERNLKKFDQKEPSIDEAESNSSSTGLVSNFKAYVQTMVKNLQELADFEDSNREVVVVNNSNNYRIKFDGQKEENLEVNDRRQPEYDEEDFIDSQRTSVLRNNQKFMKDLKKKYEDIRQAEIDAQPKKREVVAEAPKPPVEES